MSTLELNDGSVELDDAGHLQNFSQWSPEVARAMADLAGIELTDRHMKVIEMIQAYYQKHKAPPILTMVSKQCDVPYKELHGLFGKQPGKRAARLAGLPKTSGCT